MAKEQTARARKQDRGRVAGGQDYEVGYEAKKTNRFGSAVKKAVKKVGKSRNRVERALKPRQVVQPHALSGDHRDARLLYRHRRRPAYHRRSDYPQRSLLDRFHKVARELQALSAGHRQDNTPRLGGLRGSRHHQDRGGHADADERSDTCRDSPHPNIPELQSGS
jgi:hypothetical protein